MFYCCKIMIYPGIQQLVVNCNVINVLVLFVRFANIQGPLERRRAQLEKVKRIHQFYRDVEDEKIWIEEKMPLATSSSYGNSLTTVQLLIKKNHVSNKKGFAI